MSKNPFLSSCSKCNGSGQVGWFTKTKCEQCGGTGFGFPNRNYIFDFVTRELELADKNQSPQLLNRIDSGINAFHALIKAQAQNFTPLHSETLGALYYFKGCLLWDSAKFHNQELCWLESVYFMRQAKKYNASGVSVPSDIDSVIQKVKFDFQNKCSTSKQQEIVNNYRAKYPDKEINPDDLTASRYGR